jgi:hypothetical protein
MAGSLSEIRRGIAEQLALVSGLRVSEHLPEQLNPPVAIISRARVDYHQSMRGGTTEWTMEIQLIAGRMADQASQRQIDAWLSWDGPESIRASLEQDRTLGGRVQSSIVRSADALTSISAGDLDYLAVTVNLTVFA